MVIFDMAATYDKKKKKDTHRSKKKNQYYSTDL